ncbi:MAG: hypothetical protein ACI8RZ_005682 [Myxococcota bacterium]|jgi:hypothetical protein
MVVITAADITARGYTALPEINIVTKDARVSETASEVDVRMHVGSYSTRAVDGTVSGKSGNLWCSLAGRVFRSDEADLSKKWGFSSNDLYSDRDIWGPILDQANRNENFGSYQGPTDDWAVMGEVGLHGLSLGIIDWTRKEAYGAYYAADRAQNSTMWNKSSRQLYSRYEHNPTSELTLRSLLLYRESRVWGGWTEASPNKAGSDISYTHWNSASNS